MPSIGQRSSATSRASWTISSATSKLPRRRKRAPTNFPASSRKTVLSVAWIGSMGTVSRFSSDMRCSSPALEDRPDLDHTVARDVGRPRFGEVQRLIKIGHLDLSVSPNHFRSLKERAIGHQRVAARANMDTGDGMGQMESIVASNLRAMLAHPLTGLRAGLGASLLRQRLPCGKLLLRRAKQQEIFHRVLLSFLVSSHDRAQRDVKFSGPFSSSAQKLLTGCVRSNHSHDPIQVYGLLNWIVRQATVRSHPL